MSVRTRPKAIGCQRLPDVVTIQQDAGTQDAAGQQIESWSAAISGVPARISGIGGTDARYYAQMTSTATHSVWLRNDLSVTQNMRVYVERSRVANTGDVLNIEQIRRPAENYGWMELVCSQKT